MTRKVPAPRSIEGKLRRDVKVLREMCPPLLRVKVIRRELKDLLGYCTLMWDHNQPSHFVIHLHRGMSWDALWQVLIHEWAHALTWTEGDETVCDHDPAWALSLARIYQDTVEP